MPRRVDFVDETPALEDEYAGPLQRQTPQLALPQIGSALDPIHPGNPARPQVVVENIHSMRLTPSIRDSPWPLKTAEEAFLIRHFVDHISHYFDFCDPNRHFALVVPQRARKNSTLAYAVLALSARHLSRTRDFDPLVADIHYQRCCEQLIPALADNAAVTDDYLLAATVILRFLEEIDVPITGADLQAHLVGTQAIVRAQEQHQDRVRTPSGLRDAANWAAFRQDLYMALTAHRPMQLSRSNPDAPHARPWGNTDRSAGADEGDWANRAVELCGDALQFAYEESSTNKNDTYRLLLHANEDWRRDKPPSFDPFFSKMSDGPELPNIQFLACWHVMGHMYNYLADLLLVIHDPESPRYGHMHSLFASDGDEEVRRIVRTMAGVAKSNPNAPAAMLVASMAIAMCGERFHSFVDQTALFQILVATELDYGWPTTAAQQRLQDIWNFDMGSKSS